MDKNIFKFDTKLIKDSGVNLSEFLFMRILMLKPNINTDLDMSNSLKLGFVRQYDKSYYITGDGIKFIKDIEIKSIDENTDKNKSLDELAKCLQDIYPQGKKNGTNKYWRDNKPSVINKLNTFFKAYGRFDDDIVIKATEKYVKSFGDDKQLMRILPYFIIKDGNSELLTSIENIDNIKDEENNQLWTSQIV